MFWGKMDTFGQQYQFLFRLQSQRTLGFTWIVDTSVWQSGRTRDVFVSWFLDRSGWSRCQGIRDRRTCWLGWKMVWCLWAIFRWRKNPLYSGGRLQVRFLSTILVLSVRITAKSVLSALNANHGTILSAWFEQVSLYSVSLSIDRKASSICQKTAQSPALEKARSEVLHHSG